MSGTSGFAAGGARATAVAVLAWIAIVALHVEAARALTISPLDGTPDASASTQISFLGVPASQVGGVSVVGSRSGPHGGRLEPYVSAPGVSFLPARPFVAGESVTVTASVGPAARRRRVQTRFVVARPASFGAKPFPAHPPASSAPPPAGSVQSFVSEPGLQPPSVQVTVDSPQASPGDVFLAPSFGPGQHGPMILDASGSLVWFQRAPAGTVAMDFQLQRYEGRTALVWWQGRILSIGVGLGTDEIYGSAYQPLAQVAAGNGYQADLHDLQVTPQGAAFITAYTPVLADLSSAGGPHRGALLDSVLQEVDIKTGLVMFEWHAFAHVPIYDSYTHPSPGATWDYFHINSVSLDPWGDGNFIVSSRNTWAAYEISRHTGAILWRIGGRHPTFHMGSGTGMAWQHDVRWQADHTLTVFDDGAYPKVHSQSRVIRERIDWQDRSVSLVGRYAHTPALLAGSQGNDQVLPGGGSFVGWGESPFLTEFAPGGQVLFDAHLPPTGQSYRAYRFHWSAQPTTPPSIAVQTTGTQTQTAYVSWNGATTVQRWRILGGTDPNALTPLTTATRNGFETAIALHSADTWFAAQALDAAGGVLSTSSAVRPQ